MYDTDLVTNDHTVILRLNSAVVSMCLPSGLHRTAIKPAEPSSILHVHSGCSNDHTWTMPLLNMPHRMKAESDDHYKEELT